VDIVRVNVMATPRLLADLIADALISPALCRWMPGDSPALVTIVNTEPAADADSRVTIVLGDHLDDPVAVIVDGHRSSVAPTRPHKLHELVLDLARALSPDVDGADLTAV
jgi:hypothetical protein